MSAITSSDRGDEACGSGGQSEDGNNFYGEYYGGEKHLQSCSRLSRCIFPTCRQVISTPIPGGKFQLKLPSCFCQLAVLDIYKKAAEAGLVCDGGY